MAVIKFKDADLVNGMVELTVVGYGEVKMTLNDWRSFRSLLSQINGIVTDYPFVGHLLSTNEYDRYSRPRAEVAYEILQRARC